MKYGNFRTSSTISGTNTMNFSSSMSYQPAHPQPPSLAQTADLWLKIDQLHLNFLSAEDGTQKIDLRRKLEGYVHQYLCLVPQERKFCSPFISDLLFESARHVQDFSILKAAQAFEALETYASNLMNKPWRKEFKEIKEYSGFYKHKIDLALYKPERIFLAMGYRHSDEHSFVLEDSADLDSLTTVARDCLLAYVECQIVMNVFQGVSSHCPCTWEDVLLFRRNHIGYPDHAVQSLIYYKNQLQYQSRRIQAPTTYQPPQTAKLIDIASSEELANYSNDSKDSSSQPQHQIPLTIHMLEEENRRKSLLDPAQQSIGNNGNHEMPDVLELLSRVSLAKRQNDIMNDESKDAPPPALSPLSPEETQMMANIQSKWQDINTSQEHLVPNSNGFGNQDEVDAVHHRFKRDSHHHAKRDDPRKSQSEMRKSLRHSRPLEPPTLPANTKGVTQTDSSKSNKNKVIPSWECSACTFANVMTDNSCEMCGRSRKNSPELRPPTASSVSGDEGSMSEDYVACKHCTLVNRKRAKKCEACGAALTTRR